jgi:FKBP-type peptidyl-prolyl cis-trans isomerase SlyD
LFLQDLIFLGNKARTCERLMRITKDKAATLEYTLSGDQGEIIETSRGKEPLMYVHGSGGLIKGFEAALEGKSPGDSFVFSVNPGDGYGERREDLVFQAKREQFSGIPELTLGMPLRVQTTEGALIARIAEVRDGSVLLDANHPLSGRTLTFDVEVLDVRDATPEELEDQQKDGCGCDSGSCGAGCGDSCGEGCGC